jgi:predicted nucleic acid-binding protein
VSSPRLQVSRAKTSDVEIAALAIEHGLVLATHDHGFGRFKALRWLDPLT